VGRTQAAGGRAVRFPPRASRAQEQFAHWPQDRGEADGRAYTGLGTAGELTRESTVLVAVVTGYCWCSAQRWVDIALCLRERDRA